MTIITQDDITTRAAYVGIGLGLNRRPTSHYNTSDVEGLETIFHDTVLNNARAHNLLPQTVPHQFDEPLAEGRPVIVSDEELVVVKGVLFFHHALPVSAYACTLHDSSRTTNIVEDRA